MKHIPSRRRSTTHIVSLARTNGTMNSSNRETNFKNNPNISGVFYWQTKPHKAAPNPLISL